MYRPIGSQNPPIIAISSTANSIFLSVENRSCMINISAAMKPRGIGIWYAVPFVILIHRELTITRTVSLRKKMLSDLRNDFFCFLFAMGLFKHKRHIISPYLKSDRRRLICSATRAIAVSVRIFNEFLLANSPSMRRRSSEQYASIRASYAPCSMRPSIIKRSFSSIMPVRSNRSLWEKQ